MLNHNALQLPVYCFLLFLFLYNKSGRTDQSCFCTFLLLLIQLRVTNIGLTKMACPHISMLRVFEIIIIANLSEEKVSCSTTTKHISTTTMRMATKLGRQRGDLPCEVPTRKVTHVVLWDHVTNYKHHISTILMSMATKLCMLVSYLEGLLPIEPPDPSVTWSQRSRDKLSFATKPGRKVTYHEELPLTEPTDLSLIVVLLGHVTN